MECTYTTKKNPMTGFRVFALLFYRPEHNSLNEETLQERIHEQNRQSANKDLSRIHRTLRHVLELRCIHVHVGEILLYDYGLH